MNASSWVGRRRWPRGRHLLALLLLAGYLAPSSAAPAPLAAHGPPPAGLSASEWQEVLAQLRAADPQALAGWEQEVRLIAADGQAGDQFGVSVAVDGNLLVVGASQASVGGDDNQGAAYLFARHQGGPNAWGLVQKLTASDGLANDYFGFSVAVSGDKILVGAPWAEILGEQDYGAAYLFARNKNGPDQWGQVVKLISWTGAAGDRFGYAVALSGDIALVGAPWAAVGPNPDQGAAYVFARNQGGLADNWGQVQKLAGSEGANASYFGSALALSGGTAVVGAWGEDVGGTAGAGAAYVFARNQGGVADSWDQVKRLAASVPGAYHRFGWSVAIDASAGWIAAGAPYSGTPDKARRGAAYLFARNQGGVADSWGQVVKLEASDGTAADQFGYAVALSGQTALVGAPWAQAPGGEERGAVYLFARNQGGSGAWGQADTLWASLGAAGDQFGAALAISGQTILSGALGSTVEGLDGRGAAYVYHSPHNAWLESRKLTAADGLANDRFGHSVALSGDLLVVGALDAQVGSNRQQGAAYLFARDWGGAGNWGLVQKLVASDGTPGSYFGMAVDASGDVVVVGAHYADTYAGVGCGAAYVYYRNAGGADRWGLVRKLVASDGQWNDVFGYSVALSGDTVLVGAAGARPGGQTNAGAAYLFSRNRGGADQWGLVQKLTAPYPATFDSFGGSAGLSGDTAVVGAPGVDGPAGSSQGVAFVFSRNQGGADRWGLVRTLTAPDAMASDLLGSSVAISGGTVVAGATNADEGGNSVAGAAYVFYRNQGGPDAWGQVQKLAAPEVEQTGHFGQKAAVDGDTLVIAATGRVYAFARNQDGPDRWGLVQPLIAAGGTENGYFGSSPDVDGEVIVVGAPYADIGSHKEQGAAYLFAAILKAGTTTAITAHTPSPSLVGQAVTIAFSVTSEDSGTPTGSVTVTGGTESCSGSLSNGSGSCMITFTTAGSQTLTATYPGDDYHHGSVSPGVAHSVVDGGETWGRVYLPLITRP